MLWPSRATRTAEGETLMMPARRAALLPSGCR